MRALRFRPGASLSIVPDAGAAVLWGGEGGGGGGGGGSTKFPVPGN